MVIGKLAIDTGYEAPAVYAWARKQGFDQVAPIKGLEGFNRATPVSGPTFVDATIGGKRLRRGARLWSVATATFKTETYRFLRLERPSDEDRALGVLDAPGTVHLPDWIDTEWLKQLVAEQLVTVRNKRGYAHPEWQKMRERNEALDTRVYARAAAWIMGADRWDEATWRRLEAQAGVETRLPADCHRPAEPTRPGPPKAGTPDHATAETPGLHTELHEGLRWIWNGCAPCWPRCRRPASRASGRSAMTARSINYGSDAELARPSAIWKPGLPPPRTGTPRRRRWGTVASKGL
jgi:phage terminase large subunit GpA-like protein